MAKSENTHRPSIIDRLVTDLPSATVEWIGVRPARKKAMDCIKTTIAIAELGLEGDRRTTGRPGAARQVTFISAEHLQAVATLLKKDDISQESVRRNIVISGLNINALRYKTFQIGDAIFQTSAYCPPCSRMEENLGKGGFAAMLGHGGICAKILKTGRIQINDKLVVLENE